MARARSNGSDRLEDALATLIQNQAAFVGRMADIDARVAELNRINSERIQRIEERFFRIESLLLEHNRILETLPEAIREKIGFKTGASPS